MLKTYRKDIYGIAFSAGADEQLGFVAPELFKAVEKIPYEKLKHGFKLQLGFNLFILVENGAGYRIIAPDYAKNPFSDATDDLSTALWVLYWQVDFQRSYSFQERPVRFDDKIMAAKGALQKQSICLQRFSDLGKDVSGWCVEAIEKDGNGVFRTVPAADYESVYACQLLSIRPALIKVLTLPYEYVVIFDKDEIVEILDGQNESILAKK